MEIPGPTQLARVGSKIKKCYEFLRDSLTLRGGSAYGVLPRKSVKVGGDIYSAPTDISVGGSAYEEML